MTEHAGGIQEWRDRGAVRGRPWQTLVAEDVRVGLLTCKVEAVEADDGTLHAHSYLVHPGTVLVIAVVEEHKVVLIDHYRHAIRQHCLELPAGRVESDEPPAVTAARELREETGAVASELVHLGGFYGSTGSTTEWFDVFGGHVATVESREIDAREPLTPYLVPVADALQYARTGRVEDGPSALALLMSETWLENN